MSVKSPRAYAAYARDVPAGRGPACSGSAPDSRPLRARVAVRLRLLVRLGELPHHLLAPLVQSLEPPMIRMPLLPPWVFASNTMADVSFTSALGSNRSCDPVSACSATFIPMDESPGDEV